MKATALLLNWKRPDNVREIITRLRNQTMEVEIFLWNNNPDDTTSYPVDVQINSSRNFFCWPRWLMGGLSQSDFVFSMDDDFCFRNEYVALNCAHFLNANPRVDMIGYCGVVLNEQVDYWASNHYKHPEPGKDIQVDILKGRFIFTRTEFLQNTSLYHPFTRGDDIKMSANAGVKVLPGFLKDVMENLPAGDVGLDKRSPHRKLRVEVAKHYFKNHEI